MAHRSEASSGEVVDGDDGSGTARVSITNQVQPLPLLGAGAGLLGLTNAAGNLEVRVECEQQVQPDWAVASAGGQPMGDMVGAWER